MENKTIALIFSSCCNKLPQTEWFDTTWMHCCPVLQVSALTCVSPIHSRCVLSEGSWAEAVSCLCWLLAAACSFVLSSVSNNRWSSPHMTRFWLPLLPPFSISKDSCDCIHLPNNPGWFPCFKEMHKNEPFKVTYSQDPVIRIWTSLGDTILPNRAIWTS